MEVLVLFPWEEKSVFSDKTVYGWSLISLLYKKLI